MDSVLLSIVIPVYRGASFLERLARELEDLRLRLESIRTPLELVEVIFVEDSAIDESGATLRELSARWPWIRSIHLSRNFGQHPATVAGILHTSGDWVATLDEDLQHPPRFILPLLAHAVRHGKDLVYAKPASSVHESFFRDFTSRLYKTLMSWVAANRLIRDFNSFRLMRGDIARASAAVSGHNSYLDIVLGWFTDRVGVVSLPLRDSRKVSGSTSGYTLRSLLRHARKLFVSSEVPILGVGVLIGGASLVISVGLTAGILGLRWLSPQSIEIPGWTSLILVVLFFGGLLSVLGGVTLEYVASLVLSSHGKPTFFVVDRDKDDLLRPHLFILEEE